MTFVCKQQFDQSHINLGQGHKRNYNYVKGESECHRIIVGDRFQNMMLLLEHSQTDSIFENLVFRVLTKVTTLNVNAK